MIEVRNDAGKRTECDCARYPSQKSSRKYSTLRHELREGDAV